MSEYKLIPMFEEEKEFQDKINNSKITSFAETSFFLYAIVIALFRIAKEIAFFRIEYIKKSRSGQ